MLDQMWTLRCASAPPYGLDRATQRRRFTAFFSLTPNLITPWVCCPCARRANFTYMELRRCEPCFPSADYYRLWKATPWCTGMRFGHLSDSRCNTATVRRHRYGVRRSMLPAAGYLVTPVARVRPPA